jgi:DNA topoisomerase VI subunit A
MGSGKNRRELFNLSQAKSYMQTMLVSSGCKQLIEEDKTTSIRGLYYLLKHTIEGTGRDVRRPGGLRPGDRRRRGHAERAARRAARVRLEPRLDGGQSPGRQRRRDRLLADGFGRVQHPLDRRTGYRAVQEVRRQVHPACRKRHGLAAVQRGQVLAPAQLHSDPRRRPTAARRAADAAPVHNELDLPVYCLLDNDPWGYYIYSVIKQGSINLAYESKRMAIPNARYIGLRSKDYDRCNLSPSVTITLKDTDIKRAKQIASYPWFEKKKPWQKEIEQMLKNGFKLEVEALISKTSATSRKNTSPSAVERPGLSGPTHGRLAFFGRR